MDKRNDGMLATIKDTANVQDALLANALAEATSGRMYRREVHLSNIIPCWEHEFKAPNGATDKDVAATVHVLMRLRSALMMEQDKYLTGYFGFNLEYRIKLMNAYNGERRILSEQMQVPNMSKPEEALTKADTPQMMIETNGKYGSDAKIKMKDK